MRKVADGEGVMSIFRFSGRSLGNLRGVHPLLVAVVVRALALSHQDFGVSEGLRSYTRQQALYHQGATRTLQSAHLAHSDGWSWAVDMYPSGWSSVRGIPSEAFEKLAGPMQAAADEIGLERHGFVLRWGNDWDMDGVPVELDPDESFRDMPHWELRRAK